MAEYQFPTGKKLVLLLSIAMTIVNFSACSEEGSETGNTVFSPFDQVVWKSMHGSEEVDNPRAKMVKDLKVHHLKIGMSQAEVEEILGKADRLRNGQHLYRLGMGQFSVDYSYLALVYDDAGKLTAILDARS
jgi:hypothetical protein